MSPVTNQSGPQCLAGIRTVAPVGLLVLLLATTALSSTTALADNHQRTRVDAIEIAKAQSGDGRVLSVKKQLDKNGTSIFAVKIITNGRVKIFRIPELKP